MSTSIDSQHRAPTRVDKLPRLTAAPGIVRPLIAHRCRQRSVCTCGWIGRQRVLRSRGVLDALIHAARAGCHPAVPLVDVDVDIGPRP